ncbi:protein TRANSPARENT TESTA GLABRA 1-like [Telopea speciosissima]|uniref:protein TRANSPARENT TESTA GLABRA 1-like n=1 Tax=Telopea speciosissima TaxID=54955 RepID=UPI001CC56845|nr:protein TRANSPARENT TESTA GLABRA 1-like [Telopea speciosissima]
MNLVRLCACSSVHLVRVISFPPFSFSSPPPCSLETPTEKDAAAADDADDWCISDGNDTTCTSFVWNEAEPKRFDTFGNDNPCILWILERKTVDTQPTALDRELYIIAWGDIGISVFVSTVGAGRDLDLRIMEVFVLVLGVLTSFIWTEAKLKHIGTSGCDNICHRWFFDCKAVEAHSLFCDIT